MCIRKKTKILVEEGLQKTASSRPISRPPPPIPAIKDKALVTNTTQEQSKVKPSRRSFPTGSDDTQKHTAFCVKVDKDCTNFMYQPQESEVFENCAQAPPAAALNRTRSVAELFSRGNQSMDAGVRKDEDLEDTLADVDDSIFNFIFPPLDQPRPPERYRITPLDERTCISRKEVSKHPMEDSYRELRTTQVTAQTAESVEILQISGRKPLNKQVSHTELPPVTKKLLPSASNIHRELSSQNYQNATAGVLDKQKPEQPQRAMVTKKTPSRRPSAALPIMSKMHGHNNPLNKNQGDERGSIKDQKKRRSDLPLLPAVVTAPIQPVGDLKSARKLE